MTAVITLTPGDVAARRLARDLARRRRRGSTRPRMPAIEASAAGGRRDRRQGRAGLRHQYRLRQAGERAHRRRRPRDAPAQHRALARRRRRRADAGRRSARLMMALKLASLGRGASGVRPATVAHARSHAGARRHPGDPEPGLGRRLGRSRAARPSGGRHARRRRRLARRRAHAGRGRARRAPASRRSRSAPKEGLALLNGTQFSTAEALAGLFAIERVFQAALVTGALSTDAARGSDTPFDARIQRCAAIAGRSRSPPRCAR